MKKILSLLLAVLMLLSLTACASDTDRTVREARALLEAGDHRGAARRLAEDPAWQQFAELEYEIRQKNQEFLLGSWISLNGRESYEFHENGIVEYTQLYSDPRYQYTDESTYRLEGDLLEIRGRQIPVTETGGIVFLGKCNDPLALVRRENYGIAYRTVEITKDNWRDYFILRELVPSPGLDEYGNISSVWLHTALFLKEEYLDEYVAGDVTFALTFPRESTYETQWETGTLSYTMTKQQELPDSMCIDRCGLDDRRQMADEPPFSELYQGVVASCYSGLIDETGKTILREDPTVTGAEGILKLALK